MRRQRSRHHGRTLLELCVCAALVVTMAAATAPVAMYAIERQRAATAVETLRGIWSAQRLHRLHHRRFANSLEELVQQGYASGANIETLPGYLVEVQSSGDSFVAVATRAGSSWQGVFSIDPAGAASGSIRLGGAMEINAGRL